MDANRAPCIKAKALLFKTSLVYIGVIFLLAPSQSAMATSGIANTVMGFCAPMPTVPDVGSCSACHMTTNESVDDLNTAGMQAQGGNYAFFCPNATSAPTPTPPATPTTPPPGAPGSTPPETGMGMGLGADDDDDDEMEEMEDDDDMPAPAGTSSGLSALRAILRDF